MQPNVSLIKKLMMHIDFLGKNLYPVGRATLSSTSVVILGWFLWEIDIEKNNFSVWIKNIIINMKENENRVKNVRNSCLCRNIFLE